MSRNRKSRIDLDAEAPDIPLDYNAAGDAPTEPLDFMPVDYNEEQAKALDAIANYRFLSSALLNEMLGRYTFRDWVSATLLARDGWLRAEVLADAAEKPTPAALTARAEVYRTDYEFYAQQYAQGESDASAWDAHVNSVRLRGS
jgi:hypothetical protein